MASLAIEGSDLVVRLTMFEQFAAIAGGVRVPLASVRAVREAERPWRELRGVRVGTAIPGVLLLGRMLYPGGKDFVAMHGRGPAAVVELAAGQPYRRLLVSGVDARTLAAIRAALDSAHRAD